MQIDLDFPGCYLVSMLTFAAMLITGFSVSISNSNPGPPLQVFNLSLQQPQHHSHTPSNNKQPAATETNQQLPDRELQGDLEGLPLLDKQEAQQHSLATVLGLLAALACGFSGFVDGMKLLSRQHSEHLKTTARIIRACIEAYSVGHLLLYRDNHSRQLSAVAVYSLLLALPTGLLLSAVAGESLAHGSAASLLIQWLLLSASFGVICYVIVFHLINKAFSSSERKKSIYSLFILGQIIAFGLVVLSN